MNAILLDTETTGVDEPEVIEVAWMPVHIDRGTGNCFLQRYRPSKPIAMGAMAAHHIMDEDLVDCPPSSSFELPAVVEYLIGHNIDFDWKVIGSPPVKRICTLALARWLWPDADQHTLGALLYRLHRAKARVILRTAHSAHTDVVAGAMILWTIIETLSLTTTINTMEDLWRASEVARVPTIMSFGKHKGEPIARIPASYKRWLLDQPDVDPYLAKALRA